MDDDPVTRVYLWESFCFAPLCVSHEDVDAKGVLLRASLCGSSSP